MDATIEGIQIRKEKILRLKMELKFEYYLQEKALYTAKLLLPENALAIQGMLYEDPEIVQYECEQAEKYA